MAKTRGAKSRTIRLTDKGRRYLEWLRLQQYAERMAEREAARDAAKARTRLSTQDTRQGVYVR